MAKINSETNKRKILESEDSTEVKRPYQTSPDGLLQVDLNLAKNTNSISEETSEEVFASSSLKGKVVFSSILGGNDLFIRENTENLVYWLNTNVVGVDNEVADFISGFDLNEALWWIESEHSNDHVLTMNEGPMGTVDLQEVEYFEYNIGDKLISQIDSCTQNLEITQKSTSKVEQDEEKDTLCCNVQRILTNKDDNVQKICKTVKDLVNNAICKYVS